MKRSKDERVLLFVKAPRKGLVKTRLSPDLSPDAILELYKCFVDDILEMLKQTPYPVLVFHHPADAGPEIAAWLGNDIPLRPQFGDDLGAKMAEAFRSVFADGCRRAVLMGSDLPNLPREIVRQAFENLSRRDVVLGPANDGGYYMIGFNDTSFSPEMFQGMAWGTAGVFRKTLGIAGRRGRSAHLLPEWRDMDTAQDLRALTRFRPRSASRTLEFLRKSGFG